MHGKTLVIMAVIMLLAILFCGLLTRQIARWFRLICTSHVDRIEEVQQRASGELAGRGAIGGITRWYYKL